MAKQQSKESTSSYSYFKQLFHDHPDWLKEKGNDVILARYRADHGLAEDAVLEKKVLGNMATLKSIGRKQLRERGAAKKSNTQPVKSGNRLEVLEEMIDDCLTTAKNLDRDGLQDVIHLLRHARNKIVWKLGEK